MQFTIADIMREKRCDNYPRQRVVELWNGRESISHREIAALNIPVYDRIWALSRLLYRASPYRSQKIARMIALDVSDQWPCPDICWWYLTSGNEAARAAARVTAWDAVLAADWTAAVGNAARAADWAAATAAAWWDVAMAAARAADAKAAVRAAVRAADVRATDSDAAICASDAWDAALRRYLGWICRFGFEV